MAKKIKVTNLIKISDVIFDKGLYLTLSPINFLMRNVPYPLGVILATLVCITWSLFIVFVISILANSLLLLNALITIFKKENGN